jgi:hypothetical protein
LQDIPAQFGNCRPGWPFANGGNLMGFLDAFKATLPSLTRREDFA